MKKISVAIEYNSLFLNPEYTYLCKDDSIQKGMRVLVNFNNRDIVGFVTGVDVESDYENLKEVQAVLDEKPLLNDELFALADFISRRFVASKIACYKTMLPPALKPSSSSKKIIYEEYFALGCSNAPLTKKQAEYLESVKERLPLKASLVRKESKTLWKGLLEKGYLVKFEKEKRSDLLDDVAPACDLSLTAEQQYALDTIKNYQEGTFLLHGVTGSGKTEVFLQLARSVLNAGRQVLFLVPEIGLTPMMIERVQSRFGDQIAIYHSGLNPQEKYDQYQRVKNGQANIVVGTRSAVFLPFSNLGLILMDEEHDSSYKQDNSPRYHARDAAIFRANYHHCPLVLASATPSLESYARAIKGNYHLIELTERISKSMPEIRFVNLQDPNVQVQDGLSHELLQAIQDRLNKKEQAILLLNRRGYLPVVTCSDCKTTIECEDCKVPMSYHKNENALVCHICGNRKYFDHTCPNCGGHFFRQHGMGTEKLQEKLQLLFPTANIIRMDADTTRRKNGHASLLRRFEKEGDILIGTQMVAKGLDYERVSLVGILQADNMLLKSDYRTCETAFALLEQASGRAGRGKIKGEVIIQSFDLEHYVMRAVSRHAYKGFFKREMKYRKLGQYPPYTYLCSFIFMHEDPNIALKEAIEAKSQFPSMVVLGPVEISMRQKKTRIRLVVKSKNEDQLSTAAWNLVNFQKSCKHRSSLEINMNPMNLEE